MDVDTPAPQEETSVSFDVTGAGAGSGGASPPTAEIRKNLKSAVEELSNHGLKLAAKWAAEQLVGLPDETPDEQQQIGGDSRRDAFVEDNHKVDPWLEGRTVFAKTLMDVGEFERSSKAFGDKPIQVPIRDGGEKDCARGGSLPSRARFIRWYSLYLAGERRREEESQLTDALQRRRLVNPFMPSLLSQLSECDAEGSLDAFGLFMYGAVLKAARGEGRGHGADIAASTPSSSKPSAASLSGFTTPMRASRTNSASKTPSSRRQSKEGMKGRPLLSGGVDRKVDRGETSGSAMGLGSAAKAVEVLERSLRMFPYNWSAWLDLAALCLETDSVPEALEADPPCPWMFQFFLQHLLVEQHRCKDALAILENLQATFPGSSYVLSQTAVAQYHQRNFDQGHEDFKELRRRDPLRMESLDVFSNILYVKECKAELSFLAHTTVKSAPLRPETNCIIGNYYSLKGQHDKAIVYFLKALRLDRRCLSAWTLMGHEFVELKNSGAAIESYRQAVDINPKDYRAWYGLGQAYEILQMHLYATYYYRRATALRPYDARMWIAMGNCFEKLGKHGEAISTYERAMANDDREGVALEQLAKLYSAEGRKDEAAKCYETMLDKTPGNRDANAAATEKGMLFLCHHYKSKGDFSRASKIANELLDHTGTSREEALAVLREIRSTQEARQQGGSINASMNTGDRNFMTPHSGRRGSAAGRDRSSSVRMRGGGMAMTPGGVSSMLSRSAGDDASVSMSVVSDDDAAGAGAGSSGGRRESSRGGGMSGYGDAEGDGESASDILSP